jgi:hypothetical protein
MTGGRILPEFPMKKSAFMPPRPTVRALLLAVLLLCAGRYTAAAKKAVSLPEEIEWTWEVRPLHPNPQLPSVLLVGDSITRNYYPDVVKDLAGTANVYLFASSTCTGDPRLPHQLAEFGAMEHVLFRVVHFNNGMHGWEYTEEEYRAGFPALLRSVRALAGRNGKLIWASTTSVGPDPFNQATNPRIDARNEIARRFVEQAGIPIDNQHALMMNHSDLYVDSVHFNPAGAAIQGTQVAATIRRALQ